MSLDGEATDHAWWPLDALPNPLDGAAGAVARHLGRFLETGTFQVG